MKRLRRLITRPTPRIRIQTESVWGIHITFGDDRRLLRGALISPTSPERLLKISRAIAHTRSPCPIVVHDLDRASMSTARLGSWLQELGEICAHTADPVLVVGPVAPLRLQDAVAFARARGCRFTDNRRDA